MSLRQNGVFSAPPGLVGRLGGRSAKKMGESPSRKTKNGADLESLATGRRIKKGEHVNPKEPYKRREIGEHDQHSKDEREKTYGKGREQGSSGGESLSPKKEALEKEKKSELQSDVQKHSLK